MDNVIIPNPSDLEKKKAAFKKQGKNSIHILSDFDRTLTNAFNKGKKIPSLIYHLRNEHYLTEDYSAKAFALYDKYHPIEVSTTIPLEEKKAKMLEWWSSHYKLLVESGLDEKTMKKAIKEIVKKNEITLREKTNEFMELINKNEIPLIIMSASGVGNMIIDLLKKLKVFNDKIHFIGNNLEFNQEGKFIGIKNKKIIHSFNKNEAEIKSLPIHKELIKRKNIILIGDSLGDLGMLEGADFKEVIKIGFFNYEEEENLEDFKKNFDIIITNDSSFDPINQLIKNILND